MNARSRQQIRRTFSAISAALAAAAYLAGAASAATPTNPGHIAEATTFASARFVEAQDAIPIRVSETEYSVGLESTSLTPGTYTFEVTNVGTTAHDLVITGPAGETARTPVLDSGSSTELTVTLDPGTYEFWCSVPGHRMLGMTTTVTVG